MPLGIHLTVRVKSVIYFVYVGWINKKILIEKFLNFDL